LAWQAIYYSEVMNNAIIGTHNKCRSVRMRMSFKYLVGGSVFLSLALTPGFAHSAPVKIGNYVIPGAFARSLEQE
jgi:hypothetical protein